VTGLAVAVGGGLGALGRYALEGLIAPRQRGPFPLSTLLVNVSGSLLLGILAGIALTGRLGPSWLAFLGTGLVGGYTTFSTFTYETVRLIEDGAWRSAAWNLLLSGPLSFAGAWVGFVLGRGL
jgi:CrcB protein